jgi:DNA-binding transcriptional ArsR family regulator
MTGGGTTFDEHPALAPSDPASVQAARASLIDTEQAGRLAELLALVAEPTRARILFALGAVEEMCVGDLALAVGVSEDSAGYALKLLRMAGLVRTRKSGRTVLYRLAEGFPHEMLEHCLRDLLSISDGEPAPNQRKF